MKILTINQQSQNYNIKPCFTAYKNIKAIKGAKCACCGDPMIKGVDIARAYGAISKPLVKMLQEGHLTSWLDKFPIWNTLVKFAQSFPKDSYDKIITDPNNHKEISDVIFSTLIDNDNDYETAHKKLLDIRQDLSNASRSELKSAKTVLKRFKTFRDKLKPKEKEIFDLLEYYADLQPKATLKEIINDNEILRFHKDIHFKHKIKTDRIRNLHFNRIDNMIAKENPDAKAIFAKVREKGMQILLRDFDTDANIPNLKKLYKKALKENNCEKLTHKVMDEIDQMPVENIIADSFFGFASLKQLNDGEIIEYLLTPSLETFEHIKARSKGGEDKVSNGILMCKKCNEARANMPYSEFIEYHPYMPYYTQKQILQISDAILKGNLDNASRYLPMAIADTLKENSEGKINPDLTPYFKKTSRKIQKRQKEREEQLESYNTSLESSQKELEELRKKMEILNQDINATKKEVRILKSQYGCDKKFQDEIDSFLEQQKK